LLLGLRHPLFRYNPLLSNQFRLLKQKQNHLYYRQQFPLSIFQKLCLLKFR